MIQHPAPLLLHPLFLSSLLHSLRPNSAHTPQSSPCACLASAAARLFCLLVRPCVCIRHSSAQYSPTHLLCFRFPFCDSPPLLVFHSLRASSPSPSLLDACLSWCHPLLSGFNSGFNSGTSTLTEYAPTHPPKPHSVIHAASFFFPPSSPLLYTLLTQLLPSSRSKCCSIGACVCVCVCKDIKRHRAKEGAQVCATGVCERKRQGNLRLGERQPCTQTGGFFSWRRVWAFAGVCSVGDCERGYASMRACSTVVDQRRALGVMRPTVHFED